MTLEDLPRTHPDRNRPLVGCYYRWRGAAPKARWHRVTPPFRIAGKTYNELGPAWTTTDTWCWDPDTDRRAPARPANG